MSEQKPIILKEMSQLYARVFVQILDSSIAEDYMLRHVFEDFFKLVDHRTGIVDMTRPALARRLNIPIEVLNEQITKLEAPDPHSRDEDFEGRRIERLDEHRDWGWKILNWEKYDAIRKKADLYTRVSKHREKEAEASGKFQRPTAEDVKLKFSEMEMPMAEAEKFFNYYESNGWKVGKNPMKSWTSASANWKKGYEEKNGRVVQAPPARDPSKFYFGHATFSRERPPRRSDFPDERSFVSCDERYQIWLKR
jgi:hypothetical protein